MQVRNYMTGAAAVTHPDEPVVAAARLMRMRGIGALPVCEDDGTLAGMLTDRDIVVRCVSSGPTLPLVEEYCFLYSDNHL